MWHGFRFVLMPVKTEAVAPVNHEAHCVCIHVVGSARRTLNIMVPDCNPQRRITSCAQESQMALRDRIGGNLTVRTKTVVVGTRIKRADNDPAILEAVKIPCTPRVEIKR